jgi:hypothetical protein
VAVGCNANATKAVAASIIRMEMNMVKINLPIQAMNAER